MSITVIPIAHTSVDWATLQQITLAATSRSVTRPLDARAITARGLAEAVVAYGEFQQSGSDYATTLRNAGSLLRHFSVSFLAMCQTRELIVQIAIDGDLKFVDCEDEHRLYVVTATLEQWRNTLINFATQRATVAQRSFSREVLLAFDRMGLGKLFENYSRHERAGQLLLMEK